MSAPPSPDIRVDRDLVIPLADGTRVAGDLYRPAAPDGASLLQHRWTNQDEPASGEPAQDR